MKHPSLAFSNDLLCDWYSWKVIDERTLRLNLPKHQCCDAAGAIQTAKLLMPEVDRIAVFSGTALDVVYLMEDGQWAALEKHDASCVMRNMASRIPGTGTVQ